MVISISDIDIRYAPWKTGLGCQIREKSTNIRRSLSAFPFENIKSMQTDAIWVHQCFWVFLVSHSVSETRTVKQRFIWRSNPTFRGIDTMPPIDYRSHMSPFLTHLMRQCEIDSILADSGASHDVFAVTLPALTIVV